MKGPSTYVESLENANLTSASAQQLYRLVLQGPDPERLENDISCRKRKKARHLHWHPDSCSGCYALSLHYISNCCSSLYSGWHALHTRSKAEEQALHSPEAAHWCMQHLAAAHPARATIAIHQSLEPLAVSLDSSLLRLWEALRSSQLAGCF